jgi:hypothetical protein
VIVGSYRTWYESIRYTFLYLLLLVLFGFSLCRLIGIVRYLHCLKYNTLYSSRGFYRMVRTVGTYRPLLSS